MVTDKLWFASYLSNHQRRQRGNAPWFILGPLAFLILIDDISTGCRLHKYVDDTTLSELVRSNHLNTYIPTYLANLLTKGHIPLL